jgi:hypothetical protein
VSRDIVASSNCNGLEKVARHSRRHAVLLVTLLYSVLEVVGERRVAHAVRLRRGNVVAVVGCSRVHGRGRIAVGTRTTVDIALGRTMSGAARVCGKTRLALLHLALDPAAIRSLADARKDGTHGIDEMKAAVRWSEVESGLNDVVAIRIAHELLQLLGVHHLLDHHELGVLVSATNTLLDNVGAELLLRKLSDLALKALAQGGCEARLVEIEDVLHDVVAEGILHEVERVSSDLADQLDLLEARGMINATLKNAAAVTVSADGDAVMAHGIEDELRVLGFEVVQALLDDVVAVQVLNEVNHLVAQCIHDHLDLPTR